MAVAQGVIAALFGLCIGSFLNVVIWRLPRGGSLVKPERSECPSCHHVLGGVDLLPLLSYLMLRGKCRHCGAAISARYPLVEGTTCVLFVACFFRFGWSSALIASAALVSVLVVCVLVDIDHMLVLDEVLIAGGIAAILMNAAFSALCSWQDMLLGIVAGAAPLALVALAAGKITGQRAMGGGDIKFMAMAGAFLGWQNALLALVLGSVGGGLVLGALLAAKKISLHRRVPFIPMLAGGAALALFFGKALLGWYLGRFT